MRVYRTIGPLVYNCTKLSHMLADRSISLVMLFYCKQCIAGYKYYKYNVRLSAIIPNKLMLLELGDISCIMRKPVGFFTICDKNMQKKLQSSAVLLYRLIAV